MPLLKVVENDRFGGPTKAAKPLESRLSRGPVFHNQHAVLQADIVHPRHTVRALRIKQEKARGDFAFRRQPAIHRGIEHAVQLHHVTVRQIERLLMVVPLIPTTGVLTLSSISVTDRGACAWTAEDVVVDFENAVPLQADRKANRVPRWEEKGVVFLLARETSRRKQRAC